MRDQSKPLPKRFYQQVSVSSDNAILLDGRSVKTPMKAVLQLPTKALAEAVAAEWQAQEKEINPALMPLTRLANTAIDRATSERDNVIREIVEYAGSDLVCYRAETPTALVEKQTAAWDPILHWALTRLDAHFTIAQGIIHRAQSPVSLAAVEKHVTSLDAHHLTAIYMLTTLTGSALLSLMLMDRAITPEQAWSAVHVDEDFQISQWGHDDQAATRRASRRAEFDGMVRFLGLLR